jgi:hypothetical protein
MTEHGVGGGIHAEGGIEVQREVPDKSIDGIGVKVPWRAVDRLTGLLKDAHTS